MIFIDSRFEELSLENESFSNDNYKFVNIFDGCLASAIISNKKYPPTNSTLVERHVSDGSIFVVFLDKYSLSEKAINALIADTRATRIIAVFLETAIHKNGYVSIKNILEMTERDFVKYKANLAAVGVHVFECPVFTLDILLEELESALNDNVSLELYPAYVKYHIIDDWRNMVASMPMLDEERANALYKKYGEVPVIDVLRDLTDQEKNQTGFGKIVCDGLREWIGIPKGFNLGLLWKEDE